MATEKAPPGAVISLADARDADDLAAVARCLSGERDAFAVLVHRYASGVYGLCARMAGRGLAEELVQETFARAWARLAAFRHDAQLRHWLYRIALNLCRDHLKSGRAREDPSAEIGASLDPRDKTCDPERWTAGREAFAALEGAVLGLPPKYREAFVLKHLENLSYEEMSSVARMSVPALKVRVHRAREMLRRTLGDVVAGY